MEKPPARAASPAATAAALGRSRAPQGKDAAAPHLTTRKNLARAPGPARSAAGAHCMCGTEQSNLTRRARRARAGASCGARAPRRGAARVPAAERAGPGARSTPTLWSVQIFGLGLILHPFDKTKIGSTLKCKGRSVRSRMTPVYCPAGRRTAHRPPDRSPCPGCKDPGPVFRSGGRAPSSTVRAPAGAESCRSAAAGDHPRNRSSAGS